MVKIVVGELSVMIVLLALSVQAETLHLTLDDAIEMALSDGADIISKEVELTQSKADYLSGLGGVFLPTINTSLSFRRQWGTSYSFGDFNYYGGVDYVPGYQGEVYNNVMFNGDSDVSNTYTYSANLTQPLVSPSAMFAYLSARSSYRASRLKYEDATAGVIIGICDAYFGVLKAGHILEASKRAYESSKKHLEYAQRLYEMEGVSQIDVLKAQVQLSEAEIDLIEAEGALKRAMMNLNDTLGKPVETELILEEVPIEIEDYEYGECLEVMNEVKRYEEMYKSEDASALYASLAGWSMRLPSLYGNFSYYWNNERFTTENWGRNDGYYIGLTLSLNLFDGLSTEAGIMRARASRRLSKNYADRAKELAEMALRNAYISYEEAKKKLEVTMNMLETAKMELNLAERRYELGAGSIMELTEAQAQYLSSVSQNENAKYSLLTSEMELKRAMGIEVR